MGKALAHSALDSATLTIPSTNSALVIATQIGGYGTVGYHCLLDSAGVLVADSERLYTIPTMSSHAENGGPTATRPMRLSVSVVNTTKVVDRGGTVTFLNSAQRLPGVEPDTDNGPNDFSAIKSAIETSPYRKVVNGDCLLGTRDFPNKLISYPTDHTEYNTFHSHVGSMGRNLFLRHAIQHVRYITTGGTVTIGPLDRPMSVIAWLFDPPTSTNTYRVTMRASYYTRWPLETVPGYHMKPIPATDASTYNRVADKVEEQANVLTAATEGSLIALAGPKMLQGAQYLGRAAMTAAAEMTGGLGTAAGGAAASEGIALSLL